MKLVIENICKDFTNNRGKALSVLQDINLTVNKEEFVALVGPSGCGKSTLLNIASGLLEPTSGTVKFTEVEAGYEPRMSIVFQETGLFPWRNVHDNIAFGLETAGMPVNEREERIKHYIELVGLKGFEKSFPHQLSGGMRQRVGFAVGSLIGLAVGLVTGTSALADKIGNPIVNALYPIPKIALLPLFILWLGIGELSKVTIIAMGVFFPVAMNTYSGVKNVDTLLIKVAVSFNASWWKTMKSVVLPNALPMIFAGLRLAAGTSLLLLVAAEMIAAQVGIGALILHYGDLMITDSLMAGVIVLSLLGLIFNLLLQWIERKAVPWKN